MGSSGGKFGSERMEEFARSSEAAAREARDRANDPSLGQLGASEGDLASVMVALRAQDFRLGRSQGMLSGLTDELQRSALGRTSGAAISASNAARMSGGGRFGGGGNAAMVASRGAASAAGAQSAALSQALVQGRMADAQHQRGILQQRGQVAGAISTALQGQVALKENRSMFAQRAGMQGDINLSNTLAGLSGVFGGVATGGLAASGQEQAALTTGIFSLVGG